MFIMLMVVKINPSECFQDLVNTEEDNGCFIAWTIIMISVPNLASLLN